ncbi:hypothetical protein [Flavobacterium wongokense]|uniref:hypothetical protein n=1 Tax=Flavobacterium wongokense TaxID=2910674 RepID=UPI001F158B7A|nr:hypothetical protein [Flavobacterium sp. WG47]MCF6130654.1 hypothetical protein [Flavobacterium sp. WG47]
MKSSIIFLGLIALTFTTAKAANEFKSQDLDQQEFTTFNVVNTQSESQLTFVNQEFSNSNLNAGNDPAIFDPNTVIKSTYVKTVEDVIAENKLVTESKEEAAQPLSLGYTVEDRIAEQNQIIESNLSDETFPLDFERINHTVKSVKVHNNAIKAAELKL